MLEEPEVLGEPAVAAVVPVVPAVLGPCCLAVVVLVVHDERVELVSR